MEKGEPQQAQFKQSPRELSMLLLSWFPRNTRFLATQQKSALKNGSFIFKLFNFSSIIKWNFWKAELKQNDIYQIQMSINFT